MCTYTFTLPHELGRTHSPIWRDTDAHARPHVPSTRTSECSAIWVEIPTNLSSCIEWINK